VAWRNSSKRDVSRLTQVVMRSKSDGFDKEPFEEFVKMRIFKCRRNLSRFATNGLEQACSEENRDAAHLQLTRSYSQAKLTACRSNAALQWRSRLERPIVASQSELVSGSAQSIRAKRRGGQARFLTSNSWLWRSSHVESLPAAKSQSHFDHSR